jgi:formate hydrogenlyase transcriptional activator
MLHPAEQESLAAISERYEAILSMHTSIPFPADPVQVLSAIAEKLRASFNFDYISFYLSARPGDGAWYVSAADDCTAVRVARDIPLERPLSEYAIEQQTPVSIPANGDFRFSAITDLFFERGLSSVATMAINSPTGPLGSFTIASKLREAYAAEDLRLLRLAGSQAGAVLMMAESHKCSKRAELILSINNNLASNLDLQSLLRSAAANLRRTLNCDVAGIATPNAEMTNLISSALDFPTSKGCLREGHVIPIKGTVLGEVFETRRMQTLVLPNIPLDEGMCRGIEEGLKFGCIYPLVNRDRTLGVLTAGRRDDPAFTRDEIGMLCQVAHQLAIALDNAMAYREISELKDRLAQEKLYLEDEIRGEMNFDQIIGQSSSLRRVLKEVETVAPTDSNVLIYGETGSGKELIARAIHDRSGRRSNTFVKLNCAAIPTGLLESELFGHEKGAFTGAVAQRIGRFELAHHGTVFLDEIGEVSLELQPKLLRVLQEREFERLGSSRTLRSDARLIAATNRDLGAMVEAQLYRADLFYRLNVFPIHVPPLRERPDDIPLLVRHFVQQFSRRMNKTVETIPADTMSALTRYHWPGNIRELQNLIERAMILSNGPVLRVPVDTLRSQQPAPAAEAGKNQTLEDAERAHIVAVLKETNWVLAGPDGAAARLGLNRSTLRFRMGKLGIVRPGA